jgi:hypothetical protein
MSEKTFRVAMLSLLTVAATAIIILGVQTIMASNSSYTLKPYTGNGSGVLKHGTIVKLVDDKPVVVGHFDDDSGAEYPGTVQIEEVN